MSGCPLRDYGPPRELRVFSPCYVGPIVVATAGWVFVLGWSAVTLIGLASVLDQTLGYSRSPVAGNRERTKSRRWFEISDGSSRCCDHMSFRSCPRVIKGRLGFSAWCGRLAVCAR
jgi:hypothetical protein